MQDNFGLTKSEIMKTNISNQRFLSALYIALCLIAVQLKVFGQAGGATFEEGPLMSRTKIVPLTATLSDGRVAVFGGREAGFISGYYTEFYDPETNSFTSTTMTIPRDAATVVKLNDGRYLLVGGGYDWGIPAYSENELFDPENNSFVAAGTMQNPRMQCAAVQLNNNQVLIVGAWYNSSAAIVPELYDIETNTYAITGSLFTGRAQPLVLPTSDGGAMVVGGWPSFGGTLITSVEYYDAVSGTFVVFSDEIIPGETGWTAWTPNRPIEDQKLSSGEYIFLAYRSVPEPEYAVVYFNPELKTFEKKFSFLLSESGVLNGGIFDIVLDKTNNYLYIPGITSGADPVEFGLISINLTTEMVYTPESAYVFPAGEYLFPSFSFIPATGKIMLIGISTTPSDYFNGTNQTYLLKPEYTVGVQQLNNTNATVTCYPNPSNGLLHIVMQGLEPDNYLLQIIDMQGKVVFAETIITGFEEQTVKIMQQQNLIPGIYHIMIQNNNHIFDLPVVINE
jgi:hypothetical protein